MVASAFVLVHNIYRARTIHDPRYWCRGHRVRRRSRRSRPARCHPAPSCPRSGSWRPNSASTPTRWLPRTACCANAVPSRPRAGVAPGCGIGRRPRRVRCAVSPFHRARATCPPVTRIPNLLPIATVVARPGRTVLYGEPAVSPELAAYARSALSGDGVPGEHITVTAGALDGIERVLAAHLRPGDRVAVEDPGWANLLDLLAALGFSAEPIRVDDDGPVTADVGPRVAPRCAGGGGDDSCPESDRCRGVRSAGKGVARVAH